MAADIKNVDFSFILFLDARNTFDVDRIYLYYLLYNANANNKIVFRGQITNIVLIKMVKYSVNGIFFSLLSVSSSLNDNR